MPTTTTTTSTTTTSTTTTTQPTNQIASGISYLGCYSDCHGPSFRDLPYQITDSSTNTPLQCALACAQAGYLYAGTQYSNQCWCGSSVPPTQSSGCDYVCPGDSSQMCGGNCHNSVTFTGACPNVVQGSSLTLDAGSSVGTFAQYYVGDKYTENVNNPGTSGSSLSVNIESNFCDDAAIHRCADYAATFNGYQSLDLHYFASSNTWQCVAYSGTNNGPTAASYFDQFNADVSKGYGYSI
ncbi:WSC domain-containing protein [Elsinoe ampelina]|uniref:WSC domain-containing protein n=1 Tax=Elsinoe ampelina TaxID=302913 RepID=A0A6A6GH96_9PEZI|nr:WSC domain-containing protein [Elsinoe ampelina]